MGVQTASSWPFNTWIRHERQDHCPIDDAVFLTTISIWVAASHNRPICRSFKSLSLWLAPEPQASRFGLVFRLAEAAFHRARVVELGSGRG